LFAAVCFIYFSLNTALTFPLGNHTFLPGDRAYHAPSAWVMPSQPVQNQEEEQQQGDYDMHGDMHDEEPEQTTKLNRLLQEVISSSDDDVYVAFGSEPLDFVKKVGGIYIQCNKIMLILSSDYLRGKI
jgi:hypothetical protein